MTTTTSSLWSEETATTTNGTTETIAGTHLGKKSTGSELYDKSLLVAVPRSENRIAYGIEEGNLPFVGYDIWNAYEVSFLTIHNVPVSGVLKIKYACNNPFIVESKSLKLYLNSFNMTPLRETAQDSLNFFMKTVQSDLEELLQTNVDLEWLQSFTDSDKMLSEFQPIQQVIGSDMEKIECESFNENPDLLQVEDQPSECAVAFDGMRSNCRITHQPDFGDIFIKWKAPKSISMQNLLKYIVSFRKENHFHEECVEMIYKRLWDKLQPSELVVTALYTRRGGIDINPIRASSKDLIDQELVNIQQYTKRTIKQ
jgi:7-cyano-7-deazaguanine reductase